MNSPFEPLGTCCDTQDLNAELRALEKNFSSDQREKLKIDEEDLLNDAMAIKIKILTQERSYDSCIVDSHPQTLGGHPSILHTTTESDCRHLFSG